jgi:hypothetical protein
MPRLDSLEAKVESYLARLRIDFFAKKWDHFLGGGAPRSSPRGWLGFLGKAKLPFNFINLLLFTFVLPTGVLGM